MKKFLLRLSLGFVCLGHIASLSFGASTVTTVWNFNWSNGAVPEATLIQAADGLAYATTLGGGTNDLVQGGFGTVVRISTNGDFTQLYAFDYPAAGPYASALDVLRPAESRFYRVKRSR
jgi:hypothetical protein